MDLSLSTTHRRRHLRRLGGLAFASLFTACRLLAGNGLYEVREVKPNVFVWIPDDVLDQDGDPQFSRAGTAGFIITSEGVVVVDTTNSPFHARELLYEIRKRTDAPVRYVINTNSSGDYMLGNEVFVDQQATLISSSAAQVQMRSYREELARRMEDEEGWRLQARMRGFHITTPAQTFQSEMTMHLGGQDIKLFSALGHGEPGEDAAVYLPKPKVFFLGDLFRNQYFPSIGSRDVYHWIEALRRAEAWDADTYVPGHGAPGGKKELGEFRAFLERLVAQVGTRIKEGKTLDQIKKELVLPETRHWHAPELAPEGVEAVYRQLAEATATSVRGGFPLARRFRRLAAPAHFPSLRGAGH
jgi:glyoxylase-like metal-dependent hydrolase (beta-lactamase superfamily II)